MIIPIAFAISCQLNCNNIETMTRRVASETKTKVDGKEITQEEVDKLVEEFVEKPKTKVHKCKCTNKSCDAHKDSK